MAIACVAVVALAEWWQVRRTRRVAKLAFGPSGRPAAWARGVPAVRTLTMGMLAWGLTILLTEPPQVAEVEPAPEASKHVLVCLDASPSMFLDDAGPRRDESGNYQQRMVRGGEVIQAVLDRLDAENTRITVFGVYTKAVPIVEETFDKAVVQNLFDGLPVFSAFEPGPRNCRPVSPMRSNTRDAGPTVRRCCWSSVTATAPTPRRSARSPKPSPIRW
ncbi:von Willebrand factor type A [Rhodopirellula maiorica SM1]|uniref:von Willebrand factor type A n=1 Tax=Rhodopirellula maiorica SM1 TaxID=1265738 RepID=M5RFT6_9BACT|nr:von Willebrand factor type A [Rhodopirellula maiorica SM1]